MDAVAVFSTANLHWIKMTIFPFWFRFAYAGGIQVFDPVALWQRADSGPERADVKQAGRQSLRGCTAIGIAFL